MLNEDDRIAYLNKEILKKKRSIRNLELFEGTVATVLSSSIIISGTFAIIKNYHIDFIQYLTPTLVLSVLFVGSSPCVLLPTRRAMLKKVKYDKEIKEAMNELHGYALEEDKKLMLKKDKI